MKPGLTVSPGIFEVLVMLGSTLLGWPLPLLLPGQRSRHRPGARLVLHPEGTALGTSVAPAEESLSGDVVVV